MHTQVHFQFENLSVSLWIFLGQARIPGKFLCSYVFVYVQHMTLDVSSTFSTLFFETKFLIEPGAQQLSLTD